MKKAAWARIMIPALIWAMAGQTGRARTENDAGENLASLVEAERAFAGDVETKGLRAGFLLFLADRAIIFNPRPVEGRPVYERMAAGNPGILSWRPEVAEVSAAGDMGYTSGPYEFRKSRESATSTARGHYASVWIKDGNGNWRVFLDIGAAHGGTSQPAGDVVLISPSMPPVKPAAPEREKASEDLRNRATALYDTMIKSGFRKAILKFAAEDIRLILPGRLPLRGLAAAKKGLDWDAGRVVGMQQSTRRDRAKREGRVHMNLRLADSADLGLAYGTWEWTLDGTPTGESASYLWIWRKGRPGEPWKICLAVELPIPLI